MAELDRWLAELGADAVYTPDAADRLAATLASEPSPTARARRQTRLVSAACVGVACLAGATFGAVMEAGASRTDTTALLPASTDGAPTALLFPEKG